MRLETEMQGYTMEALMIRIRRLNKSFSSGNEIASRIFKQGDTMISISFRDHSGCRKCQVKYLLLLTSKPQNGCTYFSILLIINHSLLSFYSGVKHVNS